MSLLLAIDPGVTCPGAAVFDMETKRLLSARYFKGPGFARRQLADIVAIAGEVRTWADATGYVSQIVAEWPQVYGGGRSGGRKDPNDLLPLAAFNGAVYALMTFCGPVSAEEPNVYTPHEWKGSKKKNPTARMILDRLNEGDETPYVEDIVEFLRELEKAEARGVECKHPTMNALDAVGVGLHHLGRLTRRRVIAR